MSEYITTKKHTELHGDKIEGYRKLNHDELNTINMIKLMENDIENMLKSMKTACADTKWIEMAQTDFQVAFMKAVRSVAKPKDMDI